MWTHQINEPNVEKNKQIVNFFKNKGYSLGFSLETGKYSYLVINSEKYVGGNYNFDPEFGKLVTFADFKKEFFPANKMAYFLHEDGDHVIEIAIDAKEGKRYYLDGRVEVTQLDYDFWANDCRVAKKISRAEFRRFKNKIKNNKLINNRVTPTPKDKTKEEIKVGDIIKYNGNKDQNLIVVVTEIRDGLFDCVVLENKWFDSFELGKPQIGFGFEFFTKITPKWQ